MRVINFNTVLSFGLLITIVCQVYRIQQLNKIAIDLRKQNTELHLQVNHTLLLADRTQDLVVATDSMNTELKQLIIELIND